jgi:SAM-dependent methyltransferase
MIESNNPEINVDELMQKIREEVSKSHNNNPHQLVFSNSTTQMSAMNLSISYIEALLNNAESRAYVRTKWPDKLNNFPFNTKKIREIALKLLNFLFKDQRQVNFSLIQSLKESVALNRQLIRQISNLNIQIDKHLVDADNRFQLLEKDNSGKQTLTSTTQQVDVPLVDTLERFQALEEQHLLDAFYVAFEDEFRGSREDVFKRLKVYIPLIEVAKIGRFESPILDIGCGRGEWLELLHESGYTAKGIDINRVMVDQCQARGLNVTESDLISYLQALPNNSIGAITGFHIIEHLSFEVLIKLLDETLRVLQNGGMAIFESPNPENIIVGACNFYSDPTHRNPLVPTTVKFLFEQRGFSNVNLLRLREYRLEDPLQFIESDNPIASKLNPLIEIAKYNFYAPPDFAVIAKKYDE